MKIVAIANQKGGVGKTTTAINLAACVAKCGKRTLAVDIDPQGNMTSGLGVNKNSDAPAVYDVLVNDTPMAETIVPTPMEHLHLVPANISLAGAEIELVSVMAREYILKKALAQLGGAYDYVFIDCPPSLGLLTLNALTAADKLLVPIQCEFFALEGLTQLMNTVALVRRHLNADLQVEGVVMTMFDARTNLSQQVVQEVKKFFPDRVYGAFIPRNIRLAEAPSFGLPVVMYDPKCSGAEAYMDLAREFIQANSGEGV